MSSSSPSSQPESEHTASDQLSATSADAPPSPTAAEVDMPVGERQKRALEHKDSGNKYFVQGNYSQAKVLYGRAIALDPSVPVYWSNRAACELKLEQLSLIHI